MELVYKAPSQIRNPRIYQYWVSRTLFLLLYCCISTGDVKTCTITYHLWYAVLAPVFKLNPTQRNPTHTSSSNHHHDDRPEYLVPWYSPNIYTAVHLTQRVGLTLIDCSGHIRCDQSHYSYYCCCAARCPGLCCSTGHNNRRAQDVVS